jgi:hypothetical protein
MVFIASTGAVPGKTHWCRWIRFNSGGGDKSGPTITESLLIFLGEPLPVDGKITLSNRPGWGLELHGDKVNLKRPFSEKPMRCNLIC